MLQWQTLKIFVSSTFKDLELERDKLAQVFHNMEQDLLERQLTLRPYDLRWRDRHADESVEQWCIKMVQECQYFIGILGYRYGWRSPKNGYGQPNTQNFSITEMEIREALDKIAPERRFFCFADFPVPKDCTESKDDLHSIDKLKKMLEDKGEKVVRYKDIPHLLTLIQTELRQRVDAEYPPQEKATPIPYTYRDMLHEIVAEKIRGFVGRSTYLKQLEDFAQGTDRPNYLGIHAIAGTGKSALLAKFMENQKNAGIPMVGHFMSMGGHSRSLSGVLQSLGEQLQQISVITEPLKLDPNERFGQVRSSLEQAQQRFILILDGLDEIDEDGRELRWLPYLIPPNVRVILTTRPVDTWETLQGYPQLQPLELPPLGPEEIAQIIADYTQEHNLSLSKADCELLQQRAAGNPLFLKVALDEICSSGVAIGQLAMTIDALFDQILARLQARHGCGLLDGYLGLIAAGRAGVLEKELSEILHVGDDRLLSITKAMSNFIVTRSRLLDFFHPEFERTIKMRLGKSGMRQYHNTLADYLVQQGYSYLRTLDELPYQLQWSERYESLLTIFTDLTFLEKKFEAGMGAALVLDFDFALHGQPVCLPQNLSAKAKVSPDIVVTYETVRLLGRALKIDLQFLLAHPQCVFQCLWNRGYWYDSPACAQHYQVEQGSRTPWDVAPDHPCPSKLYLLMEKWRLARSTSPDNTPASPWLCSLRPLSPHLDSPLLQILRGHTGVVNSVSYSPDGKQLASASNDQTVKIWDATIGTCLLTLIGHTKSVLSVSYSPDGKKLASASSDNTVKIWDAATGTCLHTLTEHTHFVESVSYSPDGKKLASASGDATVKIWDANTGNFLLTLTGHTNKIHSLRYSSDGKTSWDDATVKIWDTITAACLPTLTGHADADRVSSVSYSPDGKTLASASYKTVKIWDAVTGTSLFTLTGYNGFAGSVSYSPDGKTLASASDDKTVKIWDATTGNFLLTLTGHTSSVRSITYSPDGKKLASTSGDNTMKIWDTNTGVCLLTLIDHTSLGSVSYSPDGKTLASASDDKTVKIWDATTGNFLLTLNGHTDNVESVSYSPDEKTLASASDDKTVKIWDATTGTCLLTLTGHTDNVTSMTYSPDGKTLASASNDETVRIWDTKTGQCLEVIAGVNAPAVFSHAQSYSYRVLSRTTETKVQNLAGKPMAYFPGAIKHITVAKDGKIAGTIGNDLVLLQLRQ